MTVLGAPIRLSGKFYDATGTLVDPGAVTLNLNLPDGTTASFTAVRDSVGVYHYDYTPALTGTFDFWFAGTGANASTQAPDIFTVTPASSSAIVSLAETKAMLNKAATSANPLSSDDSEILGFIASATDVVNWLCGFSRPTTFTETTSMRWNALATPNGVYSSLTVNRLPLLTVTSITPKFYGTALSLASAVYDNDAGIVYVPILAIPQLFSGPVQVVYQAGRQGVPTVLREAAMIIVQHLWETQRPPDMRAGPSYNAEETVMVPGMGQYIPSKAMELMVRSPYYAAPALA